MPQSGHQGVLALFTQHRVAANLLMAIMILMGIWGINKLNTQFFPNLSLAFATVSTEWRGASAEDVQSAITRPLEQELITLNNLKHLSSTSTTGSSTLVLEFEEGTDMGTALDNITEHVGRVRNLPLDAEDPRITRIINYELIARLVISGELSQQELRPLVHRIKDELLERGIADIGIVGMPREEIAIEVSNERLRELGLSLEQLATLIRQQSQDLPAGINARGDISQQIRSIQQKRDVMEYSDIVIISDAQGAYLTVADIADVQRVSKYNETQLYQGEQQAIELILRRDEHADSFEAAQVLETWLEERLPELPDTVKIQVYDEQWKLIKERIVLLLSNGLGGLLLVILIVYLFLNGRIAFWVTWGIPVSFFATLAILFFVGGSINMISLFGLIMALGIIVDDALVVAENAQSNFEQGHEPTSAALLGARNMFYPVLASSLTTIAAFFPLMSIGGPIGQIIFDLPLVVVCVVIASYIECILVLPNHSRGALTRIKRSKKTVKPPVLDRAFTRFRETRFQSILRAAVKYRFITIAATLSLLIVAIGLVAGGRISFTFFPGVDSKIVFANVSFTAGTPNERVHAFVDELGQSLRETEQHFGGNVVVVATKRVGSNASDQFDKVRHGDQYGSLLVQLISPDERDFTNAEFLREWRSRVTLPPGAENFVLTQRVGGPPGQDIDIQLRGEDAFVLKEASLALMNKLGTFAGVSAIEDNLQWGREQLIFQLTPLAYSLGLSVNDIGRQLRHGFDGALIQRFQDGNDEVDVVVRLNKEERESLSALNHMHYILPDKTSIPLSSLVTFENQRGFEALKHKDAQLSVRISANVDRTVNNSNRIIASLEEEFLPQLTQRYNLTYSLEGRAADQEKTIADMQRGVVFALVMIYIILAWVSSSYSRPLVIMAAIPFGFIGAIAGHYIMDVELTILSFFGIIGLSGIVVNDSIILISFYQRLREQGIAVNEAIIQASSSRLRAVVLTSMTTIAGLTPLLFETSIQAQFLIPMAVSITFGLAFSTILVLLVIPAMLSIIESMCESVKGDRQEENLPAMTKT